MKGWLKLGGKIVTLNLIKSFAKKFLSSTAKRKAEREPSHISIYLEKIRLKEEFLRLLKKPIFRGMRLRPVEVAHAASDKYAPEEDDGEYRPKKQIIVEIRWTNDELRSGILCLNSDAAMDIAVNKIVPPNSPPVTIIFGGITLVGIPVRVKQTLETDNPPPSPSSQWRASSQDENSRDGGSQGNASERDEAPERGSVQKNSSFRPG